jgi:hypothetical protein
MNMGRVGEERGGKEMDGCPLTGCRSGSGWLWSSEVREWRGKLESIVVGGEGVRSGVAMVVGGQ